MLKLITEKLQNQSLEDVNFPAILPKIPFQYQTRSKTRAWQTLQDAFFTDHAGESSPLGDLGLQSLLQGISVPTSKQSSFFSDLYVTPTSTTQTTTTSTSSLTSSSRSIPVNDVELFHNVMNETLSSTPSAPPKKRHCRSLSAGEVTVGRSCCSRWKPRASKIWQPIHHHCRAKLDTYQGHSPMLHATGFNSNSNSLVSSTAGATYNLASNNTDPMNEYSTPPESPIPRPASATSWDSSVNPPLWLEQASFKPLSSSKQWHRLLSLEDVEREGLSASSGSVASVTSSVDSAPETELTSSGGFARGTFRKVRAMPRCRSQPCVSDRKKCGKKRRREEDIRPKLDLFKMREASLECLSNQCTDGTKLESKIEQPSSRQRRPVCHKYQNKKLLRSAGKSITYSPEEFLGLTTIASSPCENNNLLPPGVFLPSSSPQQQPQSSVMITPTSSPTKEIEGLEDEKKREDDLNDNTVCQYFSDDDEDDDHHDDRDEEDEEEDANTTSLRSDEMFILDPCSELDLEQIEKY